MGGKTDDLAEDGGDGEEEEKHQLENWRYLKMNQDGNRLTMIEGRRAIGQKRPADERTDHPNTSSTQRQKKHECVRGKTKETSCHWNCEYTVFLTKLHFHCC